jgi:uncharacterized protein with beta-barrel porin domain
LFLASITTATCLFQVPATHAEDWDYAASTTISSDAEYSNIKNFNGGDTLNITVKNGQGANHVNDEHGGWFDRDVTFGTTNSSPNIFDANNNRVNPDNIKHVKIDLQAQDHETSYTYLDEGTYLIFGEKTSGNTKAGSASWTVKEGDTFHVINSIVGNPGESILQFGGNSDYNEAGEYYGNGGDGTFTVNGGNVKFTEGTELALGGWGKTGGNGTFTMTGGDVDFLDSYLGLGGTGNYDYDLNKSNDGVGRFDLSGGTFKISGGIYASSNSNSVLNLTGGNLILKSEYNGECWYGGDVGVYEGTINIGANAKVTLEGARHYVDANQINIAKGSTFAFDVSGLTSNDTDAAVNLRASQSGELGKFNVEILNAKAEDFISGSANTYNLINAPGVYFTLGSFDVIVNDREGFRYDVDASIIGQDSVKVAIKYDSGNIDNNNRVAEWNSNEANASWSGNAWDVTDSDSHHFKNDDQVKFKSGAANQNKNITVSQNGVTVARLSTSDPAMLVDSSANYTFEGGSITSTLGDFKKAGSGTLTIKNELNFTGKEVDLTAGNTVVDGKITADNVIVDSGATLSGGKGEIAVIVGNLTFNDGSFHRPGHSPGTFTVDGDINYNAGSKVYLDFGKTADFVQTINSGNIKFASDAVGKVKVIVGNSGDLTVNDSEEKHTVFQAGGTIQLGAQDINDNTWVAAADNTITIDDSASGGSGDHKIVFSGVSGIELQQAKVINSKQLELTAMGTIVPLPSDITPNQLAFFNSLDEVRDLGTFANYLKASLWESGTVDKAALEAALPTVNSALFVASQRNVVSANRSIYNRLHFLQDAQPRLGGFANGETIFRGQNSACDPCGSVSDPRNSRNSLTANAWFEGFGDFLRQSNTGTLQGYRSNVGGFNLGVDQRINRYTILGIGFGGAYADMKTNDHSQWGDVEQYIFSLYGSRSWDNWTFSFAGGYAYSDYDLTRHPVGVEIRSNHNGDQYFASFELAQKLRFAKYDLTPFYALDFVRLEEEGYDEYTTGSNALASSIDAQNTNSYLQTIGVKFGRSRRWHGWIVNPSVTAGWVHDYGAGNIYTTAQYAGGSRFTIKGAAINKNRGLIGANLSIATSPNLTIFGGYNGEFAGHFQVQTAQAGLNYAF